MVYIPQYSKLMNTTCLAATLAEGLGVAMFLYSRLYLMTLFLPVYK